MAETATPTDLPSRRCPFSGAAPETAPAEARVILPAAVDRQPENQRAAHIPKSFLISQAPRLLKNFLSTLDSARNRYGDVLQMDFPYSCVWFFHPNAVNDILLDRAQDFKKSENYRLLRTLLGDSVITSDGEVWRRQRRAVAPLFHQNTVRDFLSPVNEITRKCLAQAESRGDRKLQVLLCQWSLDVAANCFFGSTFPLPADRVARLFDRGARSVFWRTAFRLDGALARFVPWQNELEESMQLIDSWIADLMQQRQDQAAGEEQDILSRLLPTTERRELRDQCVSLLLAGHDTTALTLFWAIQLLWQNPSYLQRCQAEALQVTKGVDLRLAAYDCTEESLAQLPSIDALLNETVRLFPVVNTLSREALVDTEIAGVPVKKGTLVQIAPWVTHRHPEAWANPTQFQPDRFQTEPVKGSYLPFGLGARACVGQSFAWQQMKIFLLHFLAGYNSAAPAGRRPEPRPFLTLRPSHDCAFKPRAIERRP